MRKRRRVINSYPVNSLNKKAENIDILKDKTSDIVLKPYGFDIKGKFIHKDRVQAVIHVNEEGVDHSVYYVKKEKKY